MARLYRIFGSPKSNNPEGILPYIIRRQTLLGPQIAQFSTVALVTFGLATRPRFARAKSTMRLVFGNMFAVGRRYNRQRIANQIAPDRLHDHTLMLLTASVDTPARVPLSAAAFIIR